MTIHKLLIANRGEIAVRIIRAARELGLATVQVYSKADKDSLAVRLADECVDIGPAQASKSYLNRDAILAAARTTGADAIHPGYGFLAENAEFAAAVEAAGLDLRGTDGAVHPPDGRQGRRPGSGGGGRRPTVPGSRGRLESPEAAFAFAEKTGFPVMIKAAAGGGGRGIRIARSAEEFHHLMPQAQAEALAAFGDGGLYVEKLDRRCAAHRGAGAGRRTRRHPLLRARMLAAAPPSEGLGRSALALADTGHSREALFVAPSRSPRRCTTAARGRSNICTTIAATSSISWR